MSKPHEEIRHKRVAAGLSLSRVAKSLGRTRAWLSAVELGQIPITDENAAVVIKAITAIARIVDRADKDMRNALVDLKLTVNFGRPRKNNVKAA